MLVRVQVPLSAPILKSQHSLAFFIFAYRITGVARLLGVGYTSFSNPFVF